jgi:hypothetical protein
MTIETIRELQDRIHILNAATNAKGQRLALVDHKFKTELFRLRVHLADREKAEAPGVQINRDQLHGMNSVDHIRGQRNADGSQTQISKDLALLDRVQAAIDPKSIPRNEKGEAIGRGKRYVETTPAISVKLQNARIAVFDGKPLPEDVKTATLKSIEGTK